MTEETGMSGTARGAYMRPQCYVEACCAACGPWDGSMDYEQKQK